ncbi:MAG: hypothetical protein AAF384_05930 [Pseudomonadota bacterium]
MRATAPILLTGMLALLTACQSTTVRTTNVTPLSRGGAISAPLSIGIHPLDPGIKHLDPEQVSSTPGVRRAEAIYIAEKIKQTLASSMTATINVVVPEVVDSDLWVAGEIIESNGARLSLMIRAGDATGEVWYEKRYERSISRLAYDPEIRATQQPFQGLYNEIANDFRAHLDQLTAPALERIRTTSLLSFAEDFEPHLFPDYIQLDPDGVKRLVKTPASSDPKVARVKDIRARDHQFHRVLDQTFSTFAGRMSESYDDWRLQSFDETERLSQLKYKARARMIGGALAATAGIAAGASDSGVVRSAGLGAGIGGVFLIKKGIEVIDEANLPALVLAESARSFGDKAGTLFIELQDRQLKLTGTVEEQYEQWRQILRELSTLEEGSSQ